MEEQDFQRQVAKDLLSLTSSEDFALAGSLAIKEHGLINRKTNDIDLFAHSISQDQFKQTIQFVCDQLEQLGYTIIIESDRDFFFQGKISKQGMITEFDLGVDYRENLPVQLELGPTLDIRDAVANKVATVFSRGELRDFLDLDAIRQSGKFSDEELFALAKESDLGFDLQRFAIDLKAIDQFSAKSVSKYGYSSSDFKQAKERLKALSNQILSTSSELFSPASHPAPTVNATRGPVERSASEQLAYGSARASAAPSHDAPERERER